MDPARRLSDEERAALLAAARRTLEVFLASGHQPQIEVASGRLLEPGAAFVSLHRGRQLRGCIGTFEAERPLLDTVQRMAVSAATTDPRFPRVRPEELAELSLEISVLSPLRRAQPHEVQVGRHGIYITRGANRGVLLPQVATDLGWDRETFLQHTCLKARLPADAWQDPETVIEIFTADVFGEDHPAP